MKYIAEGRKADKLLRKNISGKYVRLSMKN